MALFGLHGILSNRTRARSFREDPFGDMLSDLFYPAPQRMNSIFWPFDDASRTLRYYHHATYGSPSAPRRWPIEEPEKGKGRMSPSPKSSREGSPSPQPKSEKLSWSKVPPHLWVETINVQVNFIHFLTCLIWSIHCFKLGIHYFKLKRGKWVKRAKKMNQCDSHVKMKDKIKKLKIIRRRMGTFI